MATVKSGSSARGITYNYAGEGGASYRLGELPLADAFLKDVYDRLDALTGETPPARVGDFGSGAGRVALHAPKGRKWRYVGIDHDAAAVEQAKRVLKAGDLAVAGDITDPNLADRIGGQVDAAISHRVLHALPSGLQAAFLGGLHGALREGGAAFVSAASVEDWKAQELAARGAWTPGSAVDCADLMFRERGEARSAPFEIDFFDEARLLDLAAGVGFVAAGEITYFEEPSGYAHLQQYPNAYIGVHLQKVA